MTILTVNKPEKGFYSQKEIEKTKSILEAYSAKYPEDVDYWLLDPRGIIDVSGIKHSKAFFLAEFKHYESKRKPGTLRIKWSELLACKAGSIPVFGWIQAQGKDWFIYVSPDAIPYTVEELSSESEVLTSKGSPRRTTISFFDGKISHRRIEGFKKMRLTSLEDAITLLKEKVDEHGRET